MRIGLVAPPWVPVPPTGYGGTEAVVDLLARGLRAAGEEVVLFTLGCSTCPVPRRWVYEEPQVPNFGQPKQGPKLVQGMALAIEPMLNLGTFEVEILSDGWTVITRDRKRSGHFEQTVFVGKTRPEVVTA